VDQTLPQTDPDFDFKMTLLHAIDRPLSELTVSQLCRVCGIAHSTFYRHFASKYDMVPWYALTCERWYLDEIGRTLTWHEGLSAHLSLLQKERDAFAFAVRQSGLQAALDRVERMRRGVLLETLRAYRQTPPTEKMTRYVEAYVHIEAWLVTKWSRSGMALESDALAEILENCVPQPLYEALDLRHSVSPRRRG